MNKRKSEVIFVHQNLVCHRLTLCMQNHPVSLALDLAIAQSEVWSRQSRSVNR